MQGQSLKVLFHCNNLAKCNGDLEKGGKRTEEKGKPGLSNMQHCRAGAGYKSNTDMDPSLQMMLTCDLYQRQKLCPLV